MVWDAKAPYKAESKKIVWEVAPYLRGRGLDVGAGDFKVLPHVISVDNMNHVQFGFSVKPDIMSEADDLSVFGSASMDFIYSSHTLEHVVDMEKTLKEWWRVIRQGGYLILYLPHADFYPNIGQPGANPDHKRDFRPKDVIDAMPSGWDLIDCQERNDTDEYSFLLVFKKLSASAKIESWKKPKPEKTACVVRYGAFGDNIQASSVFKGLKDQGFHVTVFASPPGSDVIQHDPHIDRLVLFDKDQVPNGNLGEFWAWHAKKYDRWVNLSESVEGTLLSLPDRIQATWPPELRHKMMNFNYLEHQHALARIPHKPQVKFYATADERKWARKQREKWGPGPVIMWSLAGSSVHKTWPFLDNILASLMLQYPTSRVILVGGADCVMLEAGWENEPRIIRTCGKWSIRESLSMLAEVDVVIGPETGVLNAAACMEVQKVVFLSHSSEENLTRDWINTWSLWSKESECKLRTGVPACHMLHYGWNICPRGKHMGEDTGASVCQSEIKPEDAWHAIASCVSRVIDMKKAA